MTGGGGVASFLHLPAMAPRSGDGQQPRCFCRGFYRQDGHTPAVSEESRCPSTVRASLFQLVEGLESRV